MRANLFVLTVLLVTIAFVPLRANDRHVVLVCLDGFAAYHLDNPALVLPHLRALAEKGTRAESNETIYPSVTHPAHTTLITGVTPREHGVLYNTMTNRETGKVFHAATPPRAESILVPTIFDAAKQAGLKTAAFHWPQLTQDPARLLGLELPSAKGEVMTAVLAEVGSSLASDGLGRGTGVSPVSVTDHGRDARATLSPASGLPTGSAETTTVAR